MEVKTAYYVGSFPRLSQCPKDGKPEYAFIGRSNVGKSSLINLLTNQSGLARTSNKPGKTQHINYYVINGAWYLVDLPGYGYAKISKTKRRAWEQMIHNYLQRSPHLQCIFILLDANIPPQQIDIEFINWMGKARLPFVIVYTKTDRLKPEQIEANVERIQQALLEHWESLPQQFITSATKKKGREEVLQLIAEVNDQVMENL
ncbi:MAG: ribosome biogenesis GTP-binding protein YihA/YsxC [Bacteroidota bacterium]